MSELPLNWMTAPIGAVTVNCAQRIPSDEEQIQYIDIASIDRDKKLISRPQCIIGKDAPSRARKHVFAGDVLVSMTRPNLNAVAMVPDSLDGQIASTGFDLLRAPELDPRWLYYIVRTNSFVERMTELVQGALYPAVKSQDVRSFEAPFAPFNEQKRIGDKLDTVLARVDACRERLNRIPAILKRFRQSVLTAATTGKLTEEWRENQNNLEDWKDTKLETIASDVFDGPFGSHLKSKDYSNTGVRVVRLENIGWLKFIEDKETFVSRKKYKTLQRHTLKAKDVLFSSFIAEEVRVCLLPFDLAGIAINKADCFCIRTNFTVCLPEYLAIQLASQSTFLALEQQIHGATRPRINLRQLKQFTFDLPPLSEQDEIVQRVESLLAHADHIEGRYSFALKQVERLTPALLAKAFRGELVPQDPNDEPASVLLDRIRTAREIAPTKTKRLKIGRGVKMSKPTAESIRNIIRQLPDQYFTFDDLRNHAATDYEVLKDILFVLLSEAQPILKQAFDTKAKTMKFVRVNQ